MVFLMLFCYMFVMEFYPYQKQHGGFTFYEFILLFWMITLMLEEIRQVVYNSI